MVQIITSEVVRRKTEIRCTYEEREYLHKKLKKTRYVQTSLFEGDGDYMVGFKANPEYRGAYVVIVSESVDRHDKLVALIEGWLIKGRGTTVQAETKVNRGDGIKIY